jgi:hypothetical protein
MFPTGVGGLGTLHYRLPHPVPPGSRRRILGYVDGGVLGVYWLSPMYLAVWQLVAWQHRLHFEHNRTLASRLLSEENGRGRVAANLSPFRTEVHGAPTYLLAPILVCGPQQGSRSVQATRPLAARHRPPSRSHPQLVLSALASPCMPVPPKRR